MLGYLTRLRRRMGARGFTQEDRLFALVQQAELSMKRLRDDLAARDGPELSVAEASPNVESPRTQEMRARMKSARRLRS
jgi:hypothetical protein